MCQSCSSELGTVYDVATATTPPIDDVFSGDPGGGTATRSSAAITSVARESFAVDHFTCADAIRMVPPNVESPLILQIFDSSYFKMQENALMFMRQNAPQRIGSLYLVCLDDVSAAKMDAPFGIPCVTIDGVTSRALLLATRVKIITCLTQGGHDVLMSDNDALWLADPIPDLRAIEGDMLFQRGTFPHKYQDPVYGVTLCAGFALYRAGSEGIGKFMEAVANALDTVGSDQVAHNAAAFLYHLEWDYNTSRSDMRHYRSTGVGRGVLTAQPGHFVVALLPHNKYTRDCNKTTISSEAIIAHCFPRHNREKAMKEASMWLAD